MVFWGGFQYEVPTTNGGGDLVLILREKDVYRILCFVTGSKRERQVICRFLPFMEEDNQVVSARPRVQGLVAVSKKREHLLQTRREVCPSPTVSFLKALLYRIHLADLFTLLFIFRKRKIVSEKEIYSNHEIRPFPVLSQLYCKFVKYCLVKRKYH